MTISLETLNALPSDDYADRLDSLYEYSPWIVERSAGLRPFPTIKSMQASFEGLIYGADSNLQRSLLQAHPDLAAKLDELACLTDFSQAEQARAGFATLAPNEFEALRSELARYRRRFDHPFILCVNDHGAEDVLPILRARISESQQSEGIACLAQVCRIGWHRLQQIVSK
ncbi:2-oxo-4-hydroxy-4-carboxy-5-ureidoimidazoline decarboxylase [Pelagicoccus sp. SDUM812002]|uniref:2-oxo-4-hydroxy-4-carboxy-5-ureidoimidazoline decarboxylase n=1 Tax=Pelagicoccus sp. SDUM812002 TaxID=3041266 RepID=UPI00280CE561|nr:2-oxo-4-hydroxy-4-carboxy-5-ureidoimidazoline decarboxylase [Pelagicoccus sp. SDUM812002]MDQ8187766.1 2-oxo-4-hydroxy-4-carboxy-5-ureidoimidazoline decarboxylase [Pelagicoccus sp. SDUM812002]